MSGGLIVPGHVQPPPGEHHYLVTVQTPGGAASVPYKHHKKLDTATDVAAMIAALGAGLGQPPEQMVVLFIYPLAGP